MQPVLVLASSRGCEAIMSNRKAEAEVGDNWNLVEYVRCRGILSAEPAKLITGRDAHVLSNLITQLCGDAY